MFLFFTFEQVNLSCARSKLNKNKIPQKPNILHQGKRI